MPRLEDPPADHGEDEDQQNDGEAPAFLFGQAHGRMRWDFAELDKNGIFAREERATRISLHGLNSEASRL